MHLNALLRYIRMDVIKYWKRIKDGRQLSSSELTNQDGMKRSVEPLIFLHVPKSAGTTMRAIIERQYAPANVYTIYQGASGHHTMSDLDALTEEQKREISIYAGHFSFGLHERIGCAPNYYAMLRDPVDRVISYYHHAISHHPQFSMNKMSLMKFFERKNLQIDNHQTRIVSGIRAPFKECSYDMLWIAIEHVDASFCAVGLTERFDESLLLLCQAMGWTPPRYTSKNVAANRPARDYFSQAEIDMVRSNNRLDEMLYAYAQRRLDEQLQQSASRFSEDLKELRDGRDRPEDGVNSEAGSNAQVQNANLEETGQL